MEATKIIGWLTFLGGIAIILFTLYASYNIFTGNLEVPGILKFESESTASELKIPESPEDIQQVMMEQLKGILPSDTIVKILNLAVWMMLAGILIFGGAQVANLGIKLLKVTERSKE